jgi:hypothetical protein
MFPLYADPGSAKRYSHLGDSAHLLLWKHHHHIRTGELHFLKKVFELNS